jgi:Na+/citrate or Na+/malate symporter
MRKGVEVGSDQKLGTPTVEELGGAFFMTLAFLALGRFFGKTLFPKILGVAIHPFAWMICFVAIAAATGIVPPRVRAASKRLQSFFTKNMVLIIMVGVGADTNLNDLIAAINPSNVVIAFLDCSWCYYRFCAGWSLSWLLSHRCCYYCRSLHG